jgi:hypothetical protein
MRRTCSLLAMVALLLGQAGVQLDGFLHLQHDLGAVRHSEMDAPPVGHSVSVCAAYSLICGAISNANLWPPLVAAEPGLVAAQFAFFLLRASAVPFQSRAPPECFRS